MDPLLLELLQCPGCAGALDWQTTSVRQGRIVDASARCAGCGAAFEVRQGVAVLLPPDDSRADPWEEVESGLAALLRENPELELALLDPEPSELGPADLLYRALALEERGDLAAAREAAVLAEVGLYTDETRACRDRMLDALVGAIDDDDGPVVDVATGRGTLVERIASRLDRPLVATDVSPHVLLRTGRTLAELGLGARISLVACDARRTPFRDGAIGTLTTYAGLANVAHPGPLLGELRRVAAGRLLAVTPFYPPGDGVNDAEIRRLGFERLLYRDALLAELDAAGWTVELRATCRAHAEPTPVGVIVEGGVIDALPAAPTELEWALVDAR